MRRLTLCLIAVLTLSGVGTAIAAWTTPASGNTAAGAASLAAPSNLTVTGQSCTPTSTSQSSISFRDGTTANGTDTVTISRPAAVAGDLLVAAFSIRSHGATVTAPAGWTLVRWDVYGGKNISTGIWHRVANDADPPTWTWTASVTALNSVMTLAAYSGVDTANPFAATNVSLQTSAAIIAGGVSPAPAGSRLVGVFTIHNNVTLSTATKMTRRLHYATPNINGGGNHQMSIELADESWLPAATATGTRTATSASSNDNIGQLLALTPAGPPVSSTISYVSGSFNEGATTVSVLRPAGVQPGDLLLASFGHRKYRNITLGGQPGWTQIGSDTGTDDQYRHAVYYRVATADDTSTTTYTFTTSGTAGDAAKPGEVAIAAYRGVDQSNPVNVVAAQNNGNGVAIAPTVTPTRADTRLVGVFAGHQSTVITPPATMTQRILARTTTVTNGDAVSMLIADESWPVANSATGTRTAGAADLDHPVGILLALKPESYPLAHLTWTGSPSTFTDAYRLGRFTGGVEVAAATLPNSTSYVTGGSTYLTPGTTYTLELRAEAGQWVSAAASTASFTAITSC